VTVVGRRIRRLEDARLVAGLGRYTDDIRIPETLHATFVRSPIAHGALRGINARAALALDGVHRVVTAADLAAFGVGELRVNWVHAEQRNSSNPVLAVDRVYYVGHPVAVVVAENPYLAEDAAGLVVLDIDELPVLVSAEDALAADASLLYPEWGTNVVVETVLEGGDVEACFSAAPVRLAGRFRVQRQAAVPMEPRASLAHFDSATDEVVLWASTQTPHLVATMIAHTCNWPEQRLRVVAPDVGGGFGPKDHAYPEDVLVCVLARKLRRPVKWVEDRREHFVATVHAREQVWDVELAADREGRVLGIRGRILYDCGGHCSNHGVGPALFAAEMMPGPYNIRNYRMEIVGVVTNKCPSGAYRGFGVPQATFVLERLLDRLARRLALDRADVRRRNLIPTSAMPYETVTHHRYDSGDYAQAFERLLELADYGGFRRRQEEAWQAGRYVGIGIVPFVIAAGLAPSHVLGPAGIAYGNYETALIRMDPNGKVTVFTGVSSQGQGVATTLAQACADRLGLDPERDVVVVQGDSALTPYSPAGAMGSRVAVVAGPAVLLAADKIAHKLRQIAGHLLEASESDIELADGHAFVRGSPASGFDIAELARQAHLGHNLPTGIQPGLEESHLFSPSTSNYPYGAHAAVVDVDPDTGKFEILRYVAVNDSGTMINPTIVEGQIYGGIVQGIGSAMLEELVYDDDGQPLTTTLIGYVLPRAADVPNIELELLDTRAPDVPGGMKGAGEIGIVAPTAVLASAIVDALSPLGVEIDELPLDPNRVWQLIAPRERSSPQGRERLENQDRDSHPR
jgi:carbon-monoxide dehydrogenase large subunit